MKKCIIYDRECIDCGECDRCDLDPEKICDNCMKCVMGDEEYLILPIDEIKGAGNDPQAHQSPEEPS